MYWPIITDFFEEKIIPIFISQPSTEPIKTEPKPPVSPIIQVPAKPTPIEPIPAKPIIKDVPERIANVIGRGSPTEEGGLLFENNSFSTWYLLLLLPFLIYLWWWYRTQRFLARKTTSTLPEMKQLFVENIDDKLFQSVDLSRSAQQLRKHNLIASSQLDIITTVEKTLQSGGWFTPVTGKIRSRPQYLVLVDRTTFNDHQAKLVNSFINKIIAEDVLMTRYYFDTDPRRCYSEKMASLSLNELVEQYPEHRLLIFSDGEGFINPITGEVADWVDQFGSQKILFTLEGHWSDREQILSQADFLIMPANEKGLISLQNIMKFGKILII